MKQRIITGVVAILIFLPVLIFSSTVALPIAIALCSAVAVYEMSACVGLKKAVALSAPFYLMSLAFPFFIRYTSPILTIALALAAITVTLIYLFAVLIFSHGKYDPAGVGVLVFTIAYILIGFNAIMIVRDWTVGGKYLYLIAFLGAWITDTFAYFCGMLFGRGGKHKLIPDVSPKKTVEGSIGGIVFCVLSMIAFALIVEKINPNAEANVLVFALMGLAVSVVSQIGDLAMSVVKRNYGIKDYGKLFPGHGGILDRFDSVIAVSSVLMILTMFFDFFERV
jgi:phosphatidate cytidylyltransferase